MKRILTAASGGVLGAAGAFGAVALLTAAPASADIGCAPKIACDVLDEARNLPNSIAQQPGQFLTNLASQPGTFATNLASQPSTFIDSANPVNQVNRFFNGTCSLDAPAGNDAECDFDNEDNDDYVGVLNQPRQFAENLASQPGTFADSILRSIGAFGPDDGPEGD